MTDFTAIKNSIDAVRADIPEGVRLVAATKTVSPEVINFAFRSGITEIGENRVEELCAKYPYLELPEGAKIHFIGTLQRRKVRSIIDKVDMIESLDNLALAAGIVGWGGVSVHMQTAAVLNGTNIKGALHFAGRLISAATAAVLAYALGILFIS